MAQFGMNEIMGMALGSSLLPILNGGLSLGGDGTKGKIMDAVMGKATGMFQDSLMGKFIGEQGTKSSRVSAYIPEIDGILQTEAMKGAGDVTKLSAVNPADNDRLMASLLTTMLGGGSLGSAYTKI